jgi:hypothetical protein
MIYTVNAQSFATLRAARAYAHQIASGMATDILRNGQPVERIYSWTAFRG